MIQKTKSVMKEEKEETLNVEIKKSILKSARVASKESEIKLKDLTAAGLLLALDRNAIEIKHILNSYQGGSK
jgi:hypothetical protein